MEEQNAASVQTTSSSAQREGRLHVPTVAHVIMATAFLAPLALLPYIPIRGRLIRLGRKVIAYDKALSAIRADLVRDDMRTEMARLRTELDAVRNELGTTRHELQESQQKRLDVEQAHARDMAALRLAVANMRDIPPEVITGMGDSFAALAYFVEEMELTRGLVPRQGWDEDPRGIQAMRRLALRLRSVAMESEKKK